MPLSLPSSTQWVVVLSFWVLTLALPQLASTAQPLSETKATPGSASAYQCTVPLYGRFPTTVVPVYLSKNFPSPFVSPLREAIAKINDTDLSVDLKLRVARKPPNWNSFYGILFDYKALPPEKSNSLAHTQRFAVKRKWGDGVREMVYSLVAVNEDFDFKWCSDGSCKRFDAEAMQ